MYCLLVYMYTTRVPGVCRVQRESPETEVMDEYKLLCECLEQSLCLLQDTGAVLNPEWFLTESPFFPLEISF